jgi:YVTN family beta-propeller protein
MAQRLWRIVWPVAAIAAVTCAFLPPPTWSAGDSSDGTAEKPNWLGPTAVAASPDGKRLFVALADAKEVAAVDVSAGRVMATVPMPAEPTAVLMDKASGKLYVSCAAPKSLLCVVDPAAMKVERSIAVGHTATGMAMMPDGSRLFVCNRFDNDVSVLAMPEGKEIARVKADREPVAAAITPDGKTVFVINLLPRDRADQGESAARLTAIDTASLAASEIRLATGTLGARAVCVSPDGKLVFVPHVVCRNALPTTEVERGWMNTDALSIVDVREKKLLATILLDDIDRGAADPWGVACSADGATLCITQAGTHDMSVIDLPRLLKKLVGRMEALRTSVAPRIASVEDLPKWDAYVAKVPLEPANDLAFLSGLRRRVRLAGNGPRGVAVVGGRAYTTMYFSDTLAAIDLKNSAATALPATVPLGPAPRMSTARRGEMLFHDATICYQHWQSCATCHPGARADAVNWDLLNDGLGNPKNTKSLMLAHRTPPAMSLGIRDTGETAVRAGFRGVLFAQFAESDAKAVDEYLKSLQPVSSPHLVGGALSAAAERGKALYFSERIGCAKCHPAPLYTDLKPHNVGSRGPYDSEDAFDTPTLIETWRTAPYLHDGHCRTIAELIGKEKHGNTAGEVEGLSEREIADLVEYVLSL